jgi:PKD repeat protein
MKSNFSRAFAALLLLSISVPSLAQNQPSWIELWQTPGTNFFTIQQAFNAANHDLEAEMREERRNGQARDSREDERLEGTYFQYKRWEWFVQPRVSPSGDLSLLNQTYPNFMNYLQQNPAAMNQFNASVARTQSPGTWSFVGPVGAPTGTGAGRLNCVQFDPNNTDIIYVGAAAGGLWKTTNGGASWVCLTDFLPSIGCSDIAIDPANGNTIYIATGDRDAGDSPSIGVMKSTDGGITWNTTGLVFPVTQQRRIARILIDPTNSNIVYAATSGGVYKTYDAGVNWYQMTPLNSMDMEFKPGDPNTIYIGKVAFYKSTNGGLTWSTVTSGLPQSSQVNRIAIAVTAAAPDNVYILASQNQSSAFEGLYLSTNSGNTFTAQSGSPNLLGWDPNGGDSDGQGWYDLAIDVAPNDADVIIVGGVNVWRSDDRGLSWSLNAHWYGGGGAPYVHADVHQIKFEPGTPGSYFIACDGGLFHTSNDGNSFNDLSSDMGIAQIYRLGLSASNASMLITGHQDNGTNLKNGSNYDEVLGGDGMDCFIDRTNNNNMFGELYYGDFHRSTNGGNNWSTITNGLTGSADWVTPWVQDPLNPNTLYAGYDQLFRSTNLGTSWSPTSTTMTGLLKDIAIAPSDNQYIYVTTGVGLSKSTDAGANWSNITPSILAGGTVTRIAVSSYDKNKIWISVSGYSANKKILKSEDGGITWTNISIGLPNIPFNCIVAVPNSMIDAVYAGSDAGVYYFDNAQSSWQPYFAGLPNTPVFDLEIYQATMMLRAATYGRGVWEVSIDQSLLTPLSAFTSDYTSVCQGQTVQFTDQSTNNPTSWNWTFAGGNPASSTQQNPTVVYNTPGVYAVILTTTNAAGAATASNLTYMYVGGSTQPPYVEGFTANTFLPVGWTGVNNGSQSAFWKRNATVGHVTPASAYFDNYNNSLSGQQDDMRSMPLNFTGYSSLALNFDVAYARYSGSRSDSLEVLISSDCGVTWTRVYVKGGSNLATAGTLTSAFTPTSSQWRTETVNLNAYANMPNVLVAFRNRNRHGNYLWLDEINITGTVSAAPTAVISTSGSICDNSSQFTDASVPAANAWAWYFPGGNPSTSNLQNPIVTWPAAGTYTVSFVATNGFGNDSTSMVVTVNAASVVTANPDSTYCASSFVALQASGAISYSWLPITNLPDPTNAINGFTLTTNSSYTVTGTDQNGCISRDTVNLTVLPAPGFGLTATPNSICLGDTASLYSSNANWTYTWMPNANLQIVASDSVIVWPTSTTTYTVMSVDTNGCTASTTKIITVSPPILPATVLVYGFQLMCSVYGANYQWYFNGTPIAGAITQYYVATQVGNYSVEAFTNQGCSSGISPQEFVNGIEEHDGVLFSIAPNPNNGEFDLNFVTNNTNDYTIAIYSLNGQLVYEEQLNAFTGTFSRHLNLSAFGVGTYAVRVSDAAGQTVRLVIVK